MPSLTEFIQGNVKQAAIAPVRLDQPVPVEDLHTPALLLDLNAGQLQISPSTQVKPSPQSALTSHGTLYLAVQ